MRTLILLGNILDLIVFRVLFNKVFWILGLFVTLLVISHNSKAAALECFTDEPKRYEFDIGQQKEGRYESITRHETGPLAGLTYRFVIYNVASLKNHDDFLTKRYTNDTPYRITYALKCKHLE